MASEVQSLDMRVGIGARKTDEWIKKRPAQGRAFFGDLIRFLTVTQLG